MEKITNFFKDAFQDMKDSAAKQHEADKAGFNAAKAEAKANWEEAKKMGSPSEHKKAREDALDKQIEEANARIQAANQRVENAKK